MFSVLRGFTCFTFNIYRCVCVAFPAILFIYHFALSPTSSWKTDFLRRAAVIPLLPSSRSVGRSVLTYLNWLQVGGGASNGVQSSANGRPARRPFVLG